MVAVSRDISGIAAYAADVTEQGYIQDISAYAQYILHHPWQVDMHGKPV
jgi:hypothetical protein